MTHVTDNPTEGPLGEDAEAGRLMTKATLAAIATAVFLVTIKAIGWALTGSVALLGSLIDSLMDGLASLVNFFAVRHSLTPPDNEHRFGHGKAEALAGMGQFAFITGSAAFLALESFQRLINPADLEAGTVGVTIVVISIIVTLALVTFQRHVVSKTNSLAVGADELHYRSDLLMNMGVIAAIILNTTGFFKGADALFGLGIAAYLGYSAFQILRRSYSELMDTEFDEEDREKIRVIVTSFPEVKDMHDLRTRRSGLRSFIQMHLEMDGTMTLLQAHEISDRVELQIRNAFQDSEVIIHQDPAGLEDPGDLART